MKRGRILSQSRAAFTVTPPMRSERSWSTLMVRLGASEPDANATASALNHADLRGVDSHGINMFTHNRAYVPGLKDGTVNTRPNRRIVRETPSTALMDNDGGLGAASATEAMELAISKARDAGSGFVGLRDGRHYGMAAHYPMMALPHDMIGISVCNSRPWVAPTFGARPMIGTNPIAVAVPANEERPFVLDMATSVVASGKFLLARRTGKKVPVGWSQDADGQYSDDPFAPVEGGWLLPLGGRPDTSSYKGYGLGAFVDVLSGMLTGMGSSVMLNDVEGVGQWFGAWRIDGFVESEEFKINMDRMIRDLRATPPLDPAKRVLIPGEIEFRNTDDRRANGVPLHDVLVRDLTELAEECGVEFPSQVSGG